MEQIAGVKYTKSAGRRYIHIDLDMYSGNEALEDFLDGLEIEAAMNEKGEDIPLEEFMKKEYKRRGLKYEAV
ncbi:MAG: hypothetical protein LBN98_04830 [Prevotellaceae bacterium]|jgi:hypothetical protein|nr:hypothetical protein [Prevotellaceae bacterium]